MPTKQRVCNYCGALLPETRLGVKLTPLKARIFDIIQRGGDDGILSGDVFAIVFGDSDPPVQRNTLRSHVNQINSEIEDTPYRIRAYGGRGRGGSDGFYRLEKRHDNTDSRDGGKWKEHASQAGNE